MTQTQTAVIEPIETTMPTDPPMVLLVEDEADIAEILQIALMHEGCNVVHAGNGLEAVAIMRTMPPPRLIVLDVMLPGMDGMLLLTYIRSRPGWENIPIVMLTAKTAPEDMFRAIHSGANSYIPKPFHPIELMNRLRVFLKVTP